MRTEFVRPAVAAACDNNENIPYSADCISFMQGDVASGMRWRVNAAESTTSASRLASPRIVVLDPTLPWKMSQAFLAGIGEAPVSVSSRRVKRRWLDR